jgi:hypothetical protein
MWNFRLHYFALYCSSVNTRVLVPVRQPFSRLQSWVALRLRSRTPQPTDKQAHLTGEFNLPPFIFMFYRGVHRMRSSAYNVPVMFPVPSIAFKTITVLLGLWERDEATCCQQLCNTVLHFWWTSDLDDMCILSPPEHRESQWCRIFLEINYS